MSYAAIQTLLVDHLKTLEELPTLQEENTKNIGESGKTFSRATMLWARPTTLTIGSTGRDMLTGLMQIDVFMLLNTGVNDVNALADSVAEHFPRGLMLSDGQTTVHVSRAWREVGQRFDAHHSVPVMVQWSSIR